jgi:pyruvate/2-oxoglutarate dehydrogenase complex dihydrolipoamide acyltransferase (E2) component
MPAETSSTTDVVMPQLGVSVTEGTVIAWSVAAGDEVAADQPLCEIDTDKIVTDIPSPAAGTLAEILVPVGDTVAVGSVLARIATRSDANARSSAWVSPVVQRIAAEHGVDLSSVSGTGRGGRVRKQDVLAAVAARPNGEQPLHSESPYRQEPEPQPTASGQLSRMRRAIGAHMKRSLETAATCTTWMEADMSRVEAARRRANASTLVGVTALPIIARCAIEALGEHPALNATLEGDRYTRHDAVHLGIAVSLGEDGLIVPVIRDAHLLAVEQLGVAIRELARRARADQLAPDEVRGGTFTITNPGQFGSLMATPVINQPQVAILDLEAIVKRPIVVADDHGDDVIAIRPQTILGLSWDHRALDGAQAAQFLGAVRRRLESWSG